MRVPRIERRSLRALKNFADNPNRHSKRQIRKLADGMESFGFIGTIVVDDQDQILAGHARREAALLAGIEEVDCVVVDYLNEAEKRAFLLADNRLALDATIDPLKLAIQIEQIVSIDFRFELSGTGFEADELDRIRIDFSPEERGPSPRDEALPAPAEGPPVCQPGDLVELGRHRLLCGDSLLAESYERLLDGVAASLVISDPPYNVPIAGHVGGSGKIKQREFAMAAGEMSREAFTHFLSSVFSNCTAFSKDGSLHYHFMDWRHLREILDAGHANYRELKNVIVWNKGVGGMGSLYRSQHELVLLFKNGSAPHVNNVQLGAKGRYRTNVWNYRGLNTGGADRLEELRRHPTAKPVQMLADAMLDASWPNSIFLDPFGGSGSTLIAAEKTGRRARLIEIDPLYCDSIVRRWQTYTKDDAVFVDTGETFRERERRHRRERADAAAVVRPGSRATSRIVDFSHAVQP